jgi:hypothetical protein
MIESLRNINRINQSPFKSKAHLINFSTKTINSTVNQIKIKEKEDEIFCLIC